MSHFPAPTRTPHSPCVPFHPILRPSLPSLSVCHADGSSQTPTLPLLEHIGGTGGASLLVDSFSSYYIASISPLSPPQTLTVSSPRSPHTPRINQGTPCHAAHTTLEHRAQWTKRRKERTPRRAARGRPTRCVTWDELAPSPRRTRSIGHGSLGLSGDWSSV
jgi:hypothetical protein